jgi:exonuclease III
MTNFNFKLLSLNARGIRDFHKRKTIFTWIKKQKVDIAFLQETYSYQEIENQFKLQWRGKMLFAHGSNHSKGVLFRFSENLQIDIRNVLGDSEGRYIFVEALVQDAPFLLVNLYAPTKNQEQCVFFDGVANTLEDLSLDHNCQIIIGGDFNSHLDSSLDNLGGRIESKPSAKKINEIMTANDLIDIWRIRNPENKQLTWTQKKPLIRRRLDYWLVSTEIQDHLTETNIIPTIKLDHSAITVTLNGLDKQKFWSFLLEIQL